MNYGPCFPFLSQEGRDQQENLDVSRRILLKLVLKTFDGFVRFEIFTAVTMKNRMLCRVAVVRTDV
jgi:hypothetical protein